MDKLRIGVGKPKIEKVCLTCGKRFKVWPYSLRNNHGKYCSSKCSALGIWKNPTEKMILQLKLTQKKARQSRIGSFHTNLTKQKISKNRTGKAKGKDNPRWRGGITSLRQVIYHSPEYKFWHDTVFKKDNYTCTKCGKRSGQGKRVYLEAHHIKEFAKYPKLVFDIRNGTTLCKDCHNLTKKFWRNQYA